jgi:hypothetical protein
MPLLFSDLRSMIESRQSSSDISQQVNYAIVQLGGHEHQLEGMTSEGRMLYLLTLTLQ